MLPMHQIIFNEKAPRVSKEASKYIFPIARWFAEEIFTYVIVFGSYASPHILPYYVPDKLLAREISYQLVVNGISKQLKDAKKAIWPNFPLQCGTFALFDIGHAYKEVSNVNLLNLAIIRKWQYHPNDVINNFITKLKMKPFVKEIDIFDDFFQGIEKFEMY